MTDESDLHAEDIEKPLNELLLAHNLETRKEYAQATPDTKATSRKFVAYTVKLPAEQLAALQSIWLELKRLYGSHSPDKSGMIQQAIEEWLRRWDGPEKSKLLDDLLQIREDTRKRQYKRYF